MTEWEALDVTSVERRLSKAIQADIAVLKQPDESVACPYEFDQDVANYQHVEVPVRPKCKFELRKSAAVSPTVVAMILMTQKKIVTSGTLPH